jgi:large subunit ribosomal protein L14e
MSTPVSVFDIGRVCIKKAGRESGKKCVVVDTIDKNFVLITGPKTLTGVRRRRVNVDHLEPLEVKIKIKRGASDEEVAKALTEALPEEFQFPAKEEKPEEAKKKVEEVEEKPAKPRRRRKKTEKTEKKPVEGGET